MITGVVKGDTIILEASVNADITNWKIRFELQDDCGNCIKLATENVTNGSTEQIEILSTSIPESVFLIKVPSEATCNFDDKAEIEIEIDTGNTVNGKPEICTIFKGDVDFKKEIITWKEV